MPQHLSYAMRPTRPALGMRWLVLVVIMFGTNISSVGGTNSHGLAAIATALHATAFSTHESHEHALEHAHEDEAEEEGIGWVTQSAAADHPHHGADHSHDKAHALPAAWNPAAPQLPGLFGLVRPWVEMVQASSLVRPPMG